MRAQERRRVDWDDPAVIERVGMNLEALSELGGKHVDSIHVLADVPAPVVLGYYGGTARHIDSDHLQAIGSVFGVENIDSLTKKFSTEGERDNFWSEHLKEKRLLNGSPKHATALARVELEQVQEPPLLEEKIIEPSDVVERVEGDTQNRSDEAKLALIAQAQPIWSGTTVMLGTTSFDIASKEVRRDIIRHMRAARGDKTLGELLEDTRLSSRASGWFGGLERGIARITQSEVEALAEGCSVSVGVLLTGHGLDTSLMAARQRKHTTSDEPSAVIRINLPPHSLDELQVFFKSKVTSSQVKQAEGVSVGDFMKVLQSEDPDWIKAFLDLTENGSKVKAIINRHVEQLKKIDESYRVIIMKQVFKEVWPDLNQ